MILMTARSQRRDYSHRDVLDKLGVREGQAVRVAGTEDEAVLGRLCARLGRAPAAEGEPADLVMYWPESYEEIAAVLKRLRPLLRPAGGLWVVMPKRGRPGYVDLANLIPLGRQAGLIDNKSISMSDRESAMRFVIPRAARRTAG